MEPHPIPLEGKQVRGGLGIARPPTGDDRGDQQGDDAVLVPGRDRRAEGGQLHRQAHEAQDQDGEGGAQRHEGAG